MFPNTRLVERYLELDCQFREAIRLVRNCERLANLAGLVALVSTTLVCWVPTRGELYLAIGLGLSVWILGRALVSRYLGAPLLRMIREESESRGRE